MNEIREWVEPMIFKRVADRVSRNSMRNSATLNLVVGQIIPRIAMFLKDMNYISVIHPYYQKMDDGVLSREDPIIIHDVDIFDAVYSSPVPVMSRETYSNLSEKYVEQLTIYYGRFKEFHDKLLECNQKDEDSPLLISLKMLYPKCQNEKEWHRNSILKIMFVKRLYDLYSSCASLYTCIRKCRVHLSPKGTFRSNYTEKTASLSLNYIEIVHVSSIFDMIKRFPYTSTTKNHIHWRDETFQIGSQLEDIIVQLNVLFEIASSLEHAVKSRYTFQSGQWGKFKSNCIPIRDILREVALRVPK